MRLVLRILFMYLLVGAFISLNSLDGTGRGSFNLLLVTIDTLRPDRLSCYGGKYLQTPQIDSLANRGVIFSRAFAHNPMTLPSHANILLGTTALYHGVHENSKSKVAEEFLTLAELLKGYGYSTGAFVGAFPLDSRFGLNQGFDVYDDYYPSRPSQDFTYAERNAGKVIEAALSWLRLQGSRWFAWVHLWDPHAPYAPPEPFRSEFKDDPYSGEVAYVDSELGKLLDYLGRAGLMEKALVIITGDHGESLGEHGELTHSYFAYNSTLWVPLVIEGPGIKSGRVEECASHLDIFPTVCDILGIKKPMFLQGISLVPLMKGKGISKRKIYFESLDAYYNRGWAPLRGFIDGKEKFIESPIPEFYDLEKDFGEERNLASGKDLGKCRRELEGIEKEYSGNLSGKSAQKIGREAQAKLRSLGYIASPFVQIKEGYGVEDDLKILLPFQKKMEQAIILNEGGQPVSGIKLLNELIAQKKNFVEAYTYLSHIYRSQGRDEEAIKVMEEGYATNPKNFIIVSGYGLLLVKEGELDRAIEVLQEALSLFDSDPQVWNQLGVAYWRKGVYQKALECYQKALALDDSDALVFSNLGALYLSLFMQGKKDEDLIRSVDYFERAVKLDSSLALAFRGLGVAQKLAGKVDKAMLAWQNSLELNPQDDFSVYNLGVAYLAKGNKAKALECFQKYLSLKNNKLSPSERREVEALIEKCK